MSVAKWIKAVDVPEAWEGQQAWRWREWEKATDPILTFIPRYSREPLHCAGVWFMRQKTPPPPRLEHV
jgi:hypothetical protein